MMKHLYRSFLFDMIVAVVALALGVVMLPVLHISDYFINILLAAALVAYLLLFLREKLKRTRGIVFGLTVAEVVILAFIILGLVIEQFSQNKLATFCQEVGVVLWLRGVVMTATLYVHALNVRKPRTQLGSLAIALALITLGAILFAGSFMTDLILEWVISIAFFIAALVFGALAFLFYIPKQRRPKSSDITVDE
ncbi:MAG: hypothetical protein IKC32_04060 [Clostridia bacterium]|nr:hypothetical protein [Clostridia bacterium]